MMRIATAKKLNQKPGCIHAQGSQSNTTVMAAAPRVGQGQCRPCRRSTTTKANIQMVRCAGTPHPENAAYKPASSKPPQPAATGTGTANKSRDPQSGVHKGASRHKRRIKPVANHAHRVMCRPEMLIKCATPVVRKMPQSLL